MTKILLQRTSSGELLSCSAKGHAGYAESGSDIVCSAISILMRTVLQVLSELKNLNLDVSVKKGDIEFSVKNYSLSLSDELKAGLKYSGDFLEKGFSSISKYSVPTGDHFLTPFFSIHSKTSYAPDLRLIFCVSTLPAILRFQAGT